MSSKPALEVQGRKELVRAMKAAGISVQDLKDVNRQVAELVVRASAARAPRQSGALVASMRPSGTQTAAQVRAGGARLPYAGPIHWGWPARNISAQPWIAEAANSQEARILGQYQQHVDQIIRKIEGAP